MEVGKLPIRTDHLPPFHSSYRIDSNLKIVTMTNSNWFRVTLLYGMAERRERERERERKIWIESTEELVIYKYELVDDVVLSVLRYDSIQSIWHDCACICFHLWNTWHDEAHTCCYHCEHATNWRFGQI